MAVAYVSRGAWTVSTGDCTPPIPAGYADGNLLVLFVETANQAVSAPSGWAEVTNSPQGTGTAGAAGGVRISLFYKIVSGTPTAPTITDSGDHTNARIYLFSGNDTTTPFNTSAGRVQETASTTYTGNALTTTRDGCLIVDFIAMDRDAVSTTNLSSWANASLASITEFDDRTDSGATGGGVGAAYGIDTTAGSVNATTATITSMVYACITVAIQPPSTSTNWQEACAISQGSTLDATQVVSFIAQSSISQAQTLNSTGFADLLNSFSIDQASTLNALGGLILSESCSISQAQTLVATGIVDMLESCSVNQASTVEANVYLTIYQIAEISQGSTVASSASAIYYGLCQINQASVIECLYTVTEGNLQVLKVWNGNAWVEGTLYRFDGNDWVVAILKRWTGSEWV